MYQKLIKYVKVMISLDIGDRKNIQTNKGRGCGIKEVTVLEKIASGLSRSPFALIEPERWFIRMNEKLT